MCEGAIYAVFIAIAIEFHRMDLKTALKMFPLAIPITIAAMSGQTASTIPTVAIFHFIDFWALTLPFNNFGFGRYAIYILLR